MTIFKLCKTKFSREECLKYYNGYTELNGERLALKPLQEAENSMNPVFEHNTIIFGYEYDRNGAETGFTQQIAEHILKPITSTLSQHPTQGGYVNRQGHVIEENGMILIYDHEVSPVSLGALAHKIAETFRQESVLVIYNKEVQFIYV